MAQASIRVVDLQHGDETVKYGRVTHREGRKVWFEDRIVMFPSPDDEVQLAEPSR